MSPDSASDDTLATGEEPLTDEVSASTPQPGPRLLAERSLGGIFVHVLGLLAPLAGPLVVYAFTSHEFTEANARNAINWQLLVSGAFAVGFVLLVVSSATEGPGLLAGAVSTVTFLGAFVAFIVVFLNVPFTLYATGKAIFGTAWEYPLAPDIV